MHIIPVIDLSRGQVVHAIRGRRADYRAVDSMLCNSSDPVDIVHAMMNLHAFEVLYIADLDAIRGNGDNRPVISRIAGRFPGLVLWVDDGRVSEKTTAGDAGTTLVIGSETGIAPSLLPSRNDHRSGFVLSLDFRDGHFIGDSALLDDVTGWPDDIIVMNLSRVGSRSGPDLALITDIQQRADKQRIYCGGGIRSIDDLQALSRSGVHGALVATALHDGTLGRHALSEILQLQ